MPGFSNILISDAEGRKAWYDGLYVQVDRPYGVGGTKYGFSVTYTLGTAEQTGGDLFSLDFPTVADYPRYPTGGDERHRLVLTGIVRLPYDFLASTFITLGSGTPYTIDDQSRGGGVNERQFRRNEGRPEQFTFIFPDAWAYRSVDLQVEKTFRFLSTNQISVIFQGFNIFSYDNFSGYQGFIPTLPATNPNFGRPSSLDRSRTPAAVRTAVRFLSLIRDPLSRSRRSGAQESIGGLRSREREIFSLISLVTPVRRFGVGKPMHRVVSIALCLCLTLLAPGGCANRGLPAELAGPGRAAFRSWFRETPAGLGSRRRAPRGLVQTIVPVLLGAGRRDDRHRPRSRSDGWLTCGGQRAGCRQHCVCWLRPDWPLHSRGPWVGAEDGRGRPGAHHASLLRGADGTATRLVLPFHQPPHRRSRVGERAVVDRHGAAPRGRADGRPVLRRRAGNWAARPDDLPPCGLQLDARRRPAAPVARMEAGDRLPEGALGSLLRADDSVPAGDRIAGARDSVPSRGRPGDVRLSRSRPTRTSAGRRPCSCISTPTPGWTSGAA